MHFFVWTEICAEVQRLERRKAAANWNVGRCTWREGRPGHHVSGTVFPPRGESCWSNSWCREDSIMHWILLEILPNQGGDKAFFWPQRHSFSSGSPEVQPTNTHVVSYMMLQNSANTFQSWIHHPPAVLWRVRRPSSFQKPLLPVPFCSDRVSMATLDGSWREDSR